MIDQFFIDPRFSQAMQVVAYGALLASILMLGLRPRAPLFFSGLFLATVDSRFGFDVWGMNSSILGLYFWAVVWLVYLSIANHKNKIELLPFMAANRLRFVLAIVLLSLIVSTVSDFSTALKSFTLIFFPYFALLPFGAALADENSGGLKAKISLLRGLQAGFFIQVALIQVFAPGDITGALGDISVNATIVGIICAYGLLITAYLLRSGADRKLRIMDLALLSCFAISALQTLSRGPLIAIAAALPIHLLSLKGDRVRSSRGSAFIVIFSIAAIVAMIVTSANDVLEKRKINAGFDVREQFLSSRYSYAQNVVDFETLPFVRLITGHGLGASEQIAKSLGAYRIESFWLEAAYDIGIPLLLTLFIALSRNAWAMARREPAGAGGFANLYLSLFLFTLVLSPASFGWFLQGNMGFVYVSILMLACRNATSNH